MRVRNIAGLLVVSALAIAPLFSFAGGTPDEIAARILARRQAAATARTEQLRLQAAAAQSTTPPPPEVTQQIATAQKTFESNRDGIVQDGGEAPNDIHVQLAAGKALVGLDSHEQARPFIDQAINLGKQSGDKRLEAEGHLLLATSLMAQKDYDNAGIAARMASKLDPTNKQALSLYHLIEGRKMLGSSVPQDDGSGKPGGGEAKMGTSGLRASESSARGAAGQGVTGQNAVTTNGGVLTKTASQEKAAELLNKAAPLMAMDAASARALIEKALLADPGSARAYALRASVERETGDLAAASEDLDRSLALNPANPQAHAERALLLIAQQRTEDEVKKEFLASGQREEDFSDYYKAQVALVTGKPADGDASSSAGPAKGRAARWLDVPLANRVRKNAPPLVGLGMGFVAAATWILFKSRKRGDGKTPPPGA